MPDAPLSILMAPGPMTIFRAAFFAALQSLGELFENDEPADAGVFGAVAVMLAVVTVCALSHTLPAADCACGFCGPESACTASVATARPPTSTRAARTEEPVCVRCIRTGRPRLKRENISL